MRPDHLVNTVQDLPVLSVTVLDSILHGSLSLALRPPRGQRHLGLLYVLKALPGTQHVSSLSFNLRLAVTSPCL